MLEEALAGRSSTRIRGVHRVSPPSSALRGRVVVAAVAVGAFAAAAAGQTLKGGGTSSDDITPAAEGTTSAMGIGGDATYESAARPDVLAVAKPIAGPLEAQKIAASDRVTRAHAAAEAERERPKYVRPAEGMFTSGFGGRWGTMHYGIDIANRLGTPIRAVEDGVVIEAGPASGFGLWVRIQNADGTISVYGHMDTFSVYAGQHVKAGDQIARMGARGNSTGTHLHFEIWEPDGHKIDPRPWLAERGISW